MYSLLNVSLLYLLLGSICIIVYFNIPSDLNSEFISNWILILSFIYLVLGFSRLKKHFNSKK